MRISTFWKFHRFLKLIPLIFQVIPWPSQDMNYRYEFFSVEKYVYTSV